MTTFWLNKKVFITGHTGFKGSWLSLWLQSLGADVAGFALEPPTKINLFSLAAVADNMTSIIGDIRDYSLLQQALTAHQPEIVFHLAAQPLVRYSYKEPVETYATNVMGTVHLFEALRNVESVKAIVNVTTDKCYENTQTLLGYTESDRLGGRDPYSNSKACSELVTQAYRQSFFSGAETIGLASARAGNVIGGGDWAADRLVPDIIHACVNKQPVLIRNPKSLRPWQHVLEPLSGYKLLAERLYQQPALYSEAWNFGPVDADIKPVSWLADYIIQLWGNTTHWQVDGEQHPHEEKCLKLDCSKAKAILGWQPRWDLTRGLQETVAWYQAFQAAENMQDISLAQINRFLTTSSIPSEDIPGELV
ncbi:MAG: CDP-glucose 4,6-dehydratase [Pseudomonadota bacterium]